MTRLRLLLPLLAACAAVGPDYVAPEPPARDRFLEAGREPGAERPSEWWAALADPTLTSLVRDAVDRSFDLRVAAARVEEARALRGVARADRYPSVDAVASAERTRDSEHAVFSAGGSSAYSQHRLGFESSWELDFWGRVRRRIEAADADQAAAEELLADARRVVIAQVASEYVALRGAERELEVTRRNLETQRATADLTRSQAEEGIGQHADAERARGLLHETEAAVPLLEARVVAGAHRLAVLTGGDAEEVKRRLAAAPSLPASPPAPALGLPSELLKARPDIRAAERELAAATARIGVAVADLYPRVTLTGRFGTEATQAKTLFDSDSISFGIGPALRWPVLDFGRVRAQIRAQGARQQAALASYERVVAQAIQEVETAVASLRARQGNRDRLAEALVHNQESLRLVDVRYREGATSFLDVLDAQRRVLSVEAEMARAQTALQLDYVALSRALGGP